ncbi:shikimate dehydrogenase [Chelativorans salis]|uniref:Shikimate dehydrogenase (NADP(+)) n=1 Tax=Chelativorans salis TaxID=2978478 RepID=A0ABT2LQY9_9HYPH|nr:shikimate dehydrogenase [Chelativorans sp. EGI FJ00035]MCT7376242.1 shikimate dehydrogenase [Chelativorans sp. EGI FJ00035]
MAEDTARAFVCGHPVAHSRSPLIHGYWLQEHGIAGIYERQDVAPEAFETFLRNLADGPYVGGNVTIPHKQTAHRLVDRRDEAAEIIGAVNTLWFENGRLCGGNTDAYGFAANLDATAPGWAEGGVATVLGAGGAGRAVVHALRERSMRDIRIVNRTVARAEELAHRFAGPTSAHGWEALPDLLADTTLLVNTTSLGMAGAAPLALDLAPLPAPAVVTDIVYVPLETPLLAAASQRGLRTADGLGMLLHQAVPGFERWFGVRPQVTPALRDIVVADLEAKA